MELADYVQADAVLEAVASRSIYEEDEKAGSIQP